LLNKRKLQKVQVGKNETTEPKNLIIISSTKIKDLFEENVFKKEKKFKNPKIKPIKLTIATLKST